MTKVVEHASFLGIRVVPEIDGPAHTQSWSKGEPDAVVTESARACSYYLFQLGFLRFLQQPWRKSHKLSLYFLNVPNTRCCCTLRGQAQIRKPWYLRLDEIRVTTFVDRVKKVLRVFLGRVRVPLCAATDGAAARSEDARRPDRTLEHDFPGQEHALRSGRGHVERPRLQSVAITPSRISLCRLLLKTQLLFR